MKTKFHSALLALGLATSGLARTGSSCEATPIDIGLVIKPGYTDIERRFSALNQHSETRQPLGRSSLFAKDAAVDLSRLTLRS